MYLKVQNRLKEPVLGQISYRGTYLLGATGMSWSVKYHDKSRHELIIQTHGKHFGSYENKQHLVWHTQKLGHVFNWGLSVYEFYFLPYFK